MCSTTPPPGAGSAAGTSYEADLSVDRTSTTPAYLQLKGQLERLITSGALRRGAALPSERTLAQHLGISRMTVRRALEGLVEAGLVEPRRGAGTFVRQEGLDQPIKHLASFSDEVARAGYQAGSTVIAIEQFPAGELVSRSLDVELGTTILRLLRLRTLDGEPFEMQDAYLPPRFLSLSIVDLTQSGSLYDSLDTQFGARPLRAVQTVGARLATQTEARYLKLPRDVPVLSKQRVTYGLDERPIEFVLCAARSDKFRMVFELGR